jgi:formylglycine-generating enzyme required for sulfatase activity
MASRPMTVHSRRPTGRRVAVVAGIVLMAGLAAGGGFLLDELRFMLRFESLGANAQGLREYRHRRTGIVMVRIPAGTFLMGSPDHISDIRTSEHPRHEVTLSPFLLSKYEVTQAEWSRIFSENPSRNRGDDIPVHGITWRKASEFCRDAGLSLPTEAQWEWACRAGDRSAIHGPRPYFEGRIGRVRSNDQRYDGMTPDKMNEFLGELDRVAWFADNSGDRLHSVGGKEPNEFGLHDMLGNVSELCADLYDSEFYSRPEATGLDPVCTRGGPRRVLRGGAFWSKTGLQLYRSTARFSYPEEDDASPIGFVGFRVAHALPH